jgi:hypothetical protein
MNALHAHAQSLLAVELVRRRRLLRQLPAARRLVVEHTIERALRASVEAVAEQAQADPALAAALDSIYGADAVPVPVGGD